MRISERNETKKREGDIDYVLLQETGLVALPLTLSEAAREWVMDMERCRSPSIDLSAGELDLRTLALVGVVGVAERLRIVSCEVDD